MRLEEKSRAAKRREEKKTRQQTKKESSNYSSSLSSFTHQGANQKFSHVLVEFSSNHGNADYTCVYRVRVHSATQINKLAGN